MDNLTISQLMLRHGISRYEVTNKQYGICSNYGLLTLVIIKEEKHIPDHSAFNELGFGIVFRYEDE